MVLKWILNVLPARGLHLAQSEHTEQWFEWEHLLCYFGDGFREMESRKLLCFWTFSRSILVMGNTCLVDWRMPAAIRIAQINGQCCLLANLSCSQWWKASCNYELTISLLCINMMLFLQVDQPFKVILIVRSTLLLWWYSSEDLDTIPGLEWGSSHSEPQFLHL